MAGQSGFHAGWRRSGHSTGWRGVWEFRKGRTTIDLFPLAEKKGNVATEGIKIKVYCLFEVGFKNVCRRAEDTGQSGSLIP